MKKKSRRRKTKNEFRSLHCSCLCSLRMIHMVIFFSKNNCKYMKYNPTKKHIIFRMNNTFTSFTYAEHFLNETKTHLPRLTELKIEYNLLETVTKNFTRDQTRMNCAHVKRLYLEEVIVHPKDFYSYFPSLSM